MTFEEDFPSFKGRVTLRLKYEEFVCKEHVIKYCLDKAKVKKVIDRCPMIAKIKIPYLNNLTIEEYFKKELGLE